MSYKRFTQVAITLVWLLLAAALVFSRHYHHVGPAYWLTDAALILTGGLAGMWWFGTPSKAHIITTDELITSTMAKVIVEREQRHEDT